MKFPEVELPSNRKFGFFFSAIFIVLAAYFYWDGFASFSVVLATIGFIFAVVTIIHAELLLPLNKLWMLFGLLLGAIVSPIVLGAIFFLLFTPLAFLMRLFGRDELRIKKQKRKSYWKVRQPRGPSPESFKHQF